MLLPAGCDLITGTDDPEAHRVQFRNSSEHCELQVNFTGGIAEATGDIDFLSPPRGGFIDVPVHRAGTITVRVRSWDPRPGYPCLFDLAVSSDRFRLYDIQPEIAFRPTVGPQCNISSYHMFEDHPGVANFSVESGDWYWCSTDWSTHRD
jgi:hypothetical protein